MKDEFDLENIDEFFAPERKRNKEAEKQARLEHVHDMKDTLSRPAGRRIIYWMIERGGLFRDDYNGRSLDLAHMSGQKLVCSEVLDLALRADPMIFAKFVEMKLTPKKGE